MSQILASAFGDQAQIWVIAESLWKRGSLYPKPTLITDMRDCKMERVDERCILTREHVSWGVLERQRMVEEGSRLSKTNRGFQALFVFRVTHQLAGVSGLGS